VVVGIVGKIPESINNTEKTEKKAAKKVSKKVGKK
jgi:hypothetical protein